MKILMVLTSHDRMGDTGEKTGFWLEEFAAPYYVFRDAGADITLASPKGGQPPVDPRSEKPEFQTDATRRFKRDRTAQAAVASTRKLADMTGDDHGVIFYPGGHGPLWDLAEDRSSIELIESMWAAGKIVSAVCHGPAAFRHTRAPGGAALVKGRNVTGFSNTEEQAAGFAEVVPFLVEDMLRNKGGLYSKAPNWHPHVQVAGALITGQNPASAEPTAKAVLRELAERESAVEA